MTSNKQNLTPMMRQYQKAKSEISPDTLLLFRMGDFYELFFEDATKGSQIMEIALTKRADIPMAGVPYHSLNNYIPKILESGLKVAIAEQVEDPKLAKGLVKREITQIISPGTIVDSDFLTSTDSNYLLGIAVSKKGDYGIAGLDISTGDFRITEVTSFPQLESELHRLQPAECILSENVYDQWKTNGFPELERNISWTPVEDWTFEFTFTHDSLLKQFQVTSLDGFGCRDLKISLQAAGAVLYYVQNNLRNQVDHITRLIPYSSEKYMVIDRISQRNLELTQGLFSDSKDSTLFSVINHTVTPMGTRMIKEWILRPLIEKDQIQSRSEAVQIFFQDQFLLLELRESLMAVKDIERTITRLNLGSANGRDLVVLQQALAAIPGIRSILSLHEETSFFKTVLDDLQPLPEINELILKGVVDTPPFSTKEGGMIREGYNAHLDELRRATKEGKSWIIDLQQKELARTGIKSLKVRYNKVFGYYIEVSKSYLDKIPEGYIRKQTLVNAERFITPELKEIEDKILGSEDKAHALELELFQEIRTTVIAETAAIQLIARAIARLDVIHSLAQTALANRYQKPQIREDSVIKIVAGRHPVIDHLHPENPFVPNDTYLNSTSDKLLMITGPNMAGKSTYIRQVALIVILAQMGSFVPAKTAEIALTDRIFTRIGAADDLSRGQSTFMVEMIETANILNNATPKSLIILDEIGRGTSTFDGISIAWAVAEYIHNNNKVQSKTLFATHYHELTELTLTLPGVKNYNVAVSETGDNITFLRKIIPGAADKSYGIHVARLAGLPKPVLDRAEEILTNLEGNSIDKESNQPKLAKMKKKKKDPVQHPQLFDF